MDRVHFGWTGLPYSPGPYGKYECALEGMEGPEGAAEVDDQIRQIHFGLSAQQSLCLLLNGFTDGFHRPLKCSLDALMIAKVHSHLQNPTRAQQHARSTMQPNVLQRVTLVMDSMPLMHIAVRKHMVCRISVLGLGFQGFDGPHSRAHVEGRFIVKQLQRFRVIVHVPKRGLSRLHNARDAGVTPASRGVLESCTCIPAERDVRCIQLYSSLSLI